MKIFWKPILWTLIILYLSLAPAESFPEVGIINFDKLVHSLIYFIQTFLFLVSFSNSNTVPVIKYYIVSGSIGVILGAGIEFLQGSIVFINRQFDWLDLLANCFGVLLAMMLFKSIKKLLVNLGLFKYL